MRIVKIRHRGAANEKQDQQSSCGFTLNGPAREERLLAADDAIDDFDDSDHAEGGCELAVVGDQKCNIPFDLYDLSDLKDVISLEAWNSCLTEEERFHLSSYLPDMDQETFVLTMKELLSADNFFFGSPSQKLLHRLKGGFYSLQVAPVRQGLSFLQKQGHYHALRLYHESMIQRFADMSAAWSSCPRSSTVEEKVRLWNNRKVRKPVLLVDLNAFPADEETVNKVEKRVEDFPLLKKTKYMNEFHNPHIPAIDSNSVALSMKPRGKGVLKLRSVERNAAPNQRMQTLPNDTWEPYKWVPKGVLKLKPKIDSFGQLEKPATAPIHTSSGVLGIHRSSFSSQLSASSGHGENAVKKLAYLHRADSDENGNINLEHPEILNDGKREELLKTGIESFSDQHGFRRKTKSALRGKSHNGSELQEGSLPLKSSQRSRMQSKDAAGIGGLHVGGNIWQNLDVQSKIPCANSSDADLFAPQNQQKPTAVHRTGPGEVAGISTVGACPQYSKHPEYRHIDHLAGGLSTTSASTVVSEVERDIIFPITYKRKNACNKFSTLESLKQLSVVDNLESLASTSTECNPTGKAKTVKIKVKAWNNHNAQKKQRLLSWLRQESPSS